MFFWKFKNLKSVQNLIPKLSDTFKLQSVRNSSILKTFFSNFLIHTILLDFDHIHISLWYWIGMVSVGRLSNVWRFTHKKLMSWIGYHSTKKKFKSITLVIYMKTNFVSFCLHTHTLFFEIGSYFNYLAPCYKLTWLRWHPTQISFFGGILLHIIICHIIHRSHFKFFFHPCYVKAQFYIVSIIWVENKTLGMVQFRCGGRINRIIVTHV